MLDQDSWLEVKRIEFHKALAGIEIQGQVERISGNEVLCMYRRPKSEGELEIARVDMSGGINRYFVRKGLIDAKT